MDVETENILTCPFQKEMEPSQGDIFSELLKVFLESPNLPSLVTAKYK